MIIAARMAARRVRRYAQAALLLVAAVVQGLQAHEVPNDVTIQAYLRPEGARLRLLVRVPLVAMRDMTWPFRSPGILDTSRATPVLTDAAMLWVGGEATMYEGRQALPTPGVVAIRATLPTDRSFESYGQALALVTGSPRPDSDEISIQEGFLDVLFEYPIASEASRFSIEPRWGRLGIHALTRLRLILPDGAVRAFELQGDPGLVRLDPLWYQASGHFIAEGFHHALGRTPLLLLLVSLVLPFRRLRDLVVVGAAFALAHSLTLLASAFGVSPDVLWFPSLIETLMAFSLVYVGVENMVGATFDRRWRNAFAFGLVYGFSLALALQPTLQLAGIHAMTARLSFNAGVGLGQVFVLTLAIPALRLLFRFAVPEWIGVAMLSAIVAHAGWHAMTASAEVLRQYHFVWPELTPAFLADLVRWMMVAVVAAGLLWVMSTLTRKPSR